jgi:hypothetical protein
LENLKDIRSELIEWQRPPPYRRFGDILQLKKRIVKSDRSRRKIDKMPQAASFVRAEEKGIHWIFRSEKADGVELFEVKRTRKCWRDAPGEEWQRK